jgi:hypothetical protein
MTDSPRFWTGCAAACALVALILYLTVGEGTPLALPVLALGVFFAMVGKRKESEQSGPE